jgi:hypothetical protein
MFGRSRNLSIAPHFTGSVARRVAGEAARRSAGIPAALIHLFLASHLLSLCLLSIISLLCCAFALPPLDYLSSYLWLFSISPIRLLFWCASTLPFLHLLLASLVLPFCCSFTCPLDLRLPYNPRLPSSFHTHFLPHMTCILTGLKLRSGEAG